MTSRTRKWVVLATYSAAAGLSQCLWLNFAPLISQVERKYGVTEDQAGLLLLVFPLVYALLSLPTGALIDRRGYRFGVGLGTVIMAAFACLRVFDSSFNFLLAAQVGISIGQPLVVNGISKLVLDWFGTKDEAMATGIGTVGMFLGMAVGMSATPYFVEQLGWTGTMILFAAISVAVAVAFLIFVHPNPDSSHSSAQAPTTPAPASGELRSLAVDRDLLLVFLLSFLGLGFFNGLTTWLEPILAPYGLDSLKAGVVGGVLILGGIVGAALIPALSDHFGRRKPFLIGSIAAALALTLPLCSSGNFTALIILGAALGFFFLPAYAIMLAMCSELSGAARAGAATGLLMLTGNVGGVVVILAMQWVKSDTTGFRPAIYLLLALLAIAIAAAFAVRETGVKRSRE